MVRVVRAQVHEVEPVCYNVIRSFHESSTRDEYIWNTGVIVGKVALFKKPGKWTLEVYPDEGAVVLRGRRGIVLSVEVDQPLVRVKACDMLFEVTDLGDLLPVYFTSDVPYAVPVSLYDVVTKALKYKDAAVAEYYKPAEATTTTTT